MPWVGKLVVRDPASRRPSPLNRWWFKMACALALFFVGGWLLAGHWQAAVKQTISLALILLLVYLARTTPSGDRHLKP